jgi:two-component system sensor histidine kinase AlgZ
MHPILAARDRLLLYLAAWLPIAGLLTGLLVFAGRLSWSEAALVAFPLTLVYAFLCLCAWYLCRAFPLGKTGVLRLFGMHAVAAVVSSSLWTVMGRGLAFGLSAFPAFAAIDEHFRAQTPLLMGVGILIFLLAIVGHYLLSMIESSREAERRVLEMKVLAREAELRALRAQIDPHFLFNSLNSISALTAINPAASRTMCQSLAEFLRKSLDLGVRDCIRLDEEFALASSYLAVEQVRLGARLKVRKEIDEASRSCLVPPLLLQPLMENAIHHGIAHLIEGGEIRLVAARPGGRLSIVVENPCDPDRPRSNGGGIGLANVRGRLDTAYGSDAWLEVESGEERFRVVVSLPAREQVHYERNSAGHP